MKCSLLRYLFQQGLLAVLLWLMLNALAMGQPAIGKKTFVSWKMVDAPTKSLASRLKLILDDYYKGSDLLFETGAFIRVLQWRSDFEHVAAVYRYVGWKDLCAIVKVETQGMTGRQVSKANAIGISQIRYPGAWSFLWDAMFSTHIRMGSKLVKDYHNNRIRKRYAFQLRRIQGYLKRAGVVVIPEDSSPEAFRKARRQSWHNLERHLARPFRVSQYQVAVDIAALYIDHLRQTLRIIRDQLIQIEAHFKTNSVSDLQQSGLSGTLKRRWQRISRNLPGYIFFSTPVIQQKAVLNHLRKGIATLDSPLIYGAAYNLGIHRIIAAVESARDIPEAGKRYTRKVKKYLEIFDRIDQPV